MSGRRELMLLPSVMGGVRRVPITRQGADLTAGLDIFRYRYIIPAWHGQRQRGRVQRRRGAAKAPDPRPALGGERPVNELVASLRLGAAAGVQAPAGAPGGGASVRGDGRRRLYSLNGARSSHPRLGQGYEHPWSERFDASTSCWTSSRKEDERRHSEYRHASTPPTASDPDHTRVRRAERLV